MPNHFGQLILNKDLNKEAMGNMRKEKTIKGVKVKFKGKEIKNVTGFYYDGYEGKFFINYKECKKLN